jgi:Na+-translocating ferredoxin:NAD+ oxidoreductase RnfE subunit
VKNRKLLLRETGTIFLNGVFYKNPVLVGALGLYPIVAAGYNLRNAVELSILFFLLSLPTALVFCQIGELIPLWLRPGTVLIASAVFYLPASWLTGKLFEDSIAALGMFAGLMICNSVILSRSNDYAPTHIGWAVAADAVGCSVGFTLVICVTAAIREYLLKGGVWHTNTGIYGTADAGISLPFFGFILLGFFAAFVQWINEKRSRAAAKKKVKQG